MSTWGIAFVVLVISVAVLLAIYLLTPREHATTADTIAAVSRAITAVA